MDAHRAAAANLRICAAGDIDPATVAAVLWISRRIVPDYRWR